MAYLKPQSPLQHKDGDYFYPLTTVDQIIMEDGSRLNTVFHHSIKTNAVLYASKWSETAPYTQTINIKESEINSDLNIDVNVIYSGNQNTDSLLNTNANYLTYTKIIGDNIVFYCLSKKPQVDIPIEIQGICNNTIAGIDNLDFKIIGGTIQPDTATENTIWVNTDVNITGYYFSVTEPSNAVEGEVWIKTMPNTSIIEMDVADNIKIYPVYLKQYIENTWEIKDVQIYQNGMWNKWWDGTLYYAGDTYDHITGGWLKGTGNPVSSIDNSNGYLTLTGAGSSTMGFAYMANTIDLSNVDSITVEAASSTTSKRCSFVIRGNGATVSQTFIQNTTSQTYTIDTSTMDGKYELWGRIDSSESTKWKLYFYRIKLNFA